MGPMTRPRFVLPRSQRHRPADASGRGVSPMHQLQRTGPHTFFMMLNIVGS